MRRSLAVLGFATFVSCATIHTLPISEPPRSVTKIFMMSVRDLQELQLFREKIYPELIKYYQEKLNKGNMSAVQYGICQFRLAIAYIGNGELEKAFDALGPVIPADNNHLDSMYFIIRFFIKEAIISYAKEFGELNDSLVLSVFNVRVNPVISFEYKLDYLHFLSMKDFTRFLQLGGSKYNSTEHPVDTVPNSDVLFTTKALDTLVQNIR